jgi:ACS family glucarate transporter-like MFS transporter
MAQGSGSPTLRKRPAERATKVRYLVVIFAVMLAVVQYLDRVAISSAAAVPAIRRDLGLSEVEMGWVFGAFGLAYAIFDIPGGYLGDWLGPRRVLLRVVLWWSFFTAATGWTWNLMSILVTRFLFGAGEAGCFPNLTKVFTTWLPPDERIRAQGVLWMSARWGGAFSPLLVTPVILWVGWRGAFGIFGSLGVIWAFLFYRWYRNDPMTHPGLNDGERQLLRPSSTNAEGHGDVPWRKILSSGRVWMLCWQYFALSYGWYFYITWLPTYLRDGRHLTITSTTLLSVLPLFMGGLANPVSVFVGERLTRRTGSLNLTRRIIASAGFAGACGCLILSTRVGDPLLAMIVIATASFCNDMVMPCAWGATMDLGGRYAGTVSGTMNSVGNLAAVALPVSIPYILRWASNDWNVTFYVSGAIYSTGILSWIFLDSVTPLERFREELSV